VEREVIPGGDDDSDEALFDYACRVAKTDHHPVGTCKMGTDKNSVVDPQFLLPDYKVQQLVCSGMVHTGISTIGLVVIRETDGHMEKNKATDSSMEKDLGDDANILAAVLKAGAETSLSYYRKPVSIEVKADQSPVTIADKNTEKAMRAIIDDACPSDGVWGEEQGRNESGNRLWVIDPIDGTKSFLLGNPLYGCLAGLVENGAVKVGGAAVPPLNEYWIAAHGKGAYLNGQRLQASGQTQLSNASIQCTSPDFFEDDERVRFDRISSQARFRRYGGDCYSFLQLAAGWVDAVIESSLQPYDFVALVPIIEEAGGIITDWEGKALNVDSGPQVVAAASAELHRTILEQL